MSTEDVHLLFPRLKQRVDPSFKFLCRLLVFLFNGLPSESSTLLALSKLREIRDKTVRHENCLLTAARAFRATLTISLATGSNEPCGGLSFMPFGAVFCLFDRRGAIKVTKRCLILMALF